MNVSLKSRIFLYNAEEVLVKQRFLDVGHFSTFALSPKSSLSLGVSYRNRDWFEDSENEFRTTLQYTLKGVSSSNRIGHRLRAEQRFFESKTVFRFRYRMAFDKPLNGERLNVGESYIIGTGELLWSVTKSDVPTFSNRWSGQIGWLVTEKTKIQLGLEYRFDRFTTTTNPALMLLMSAIFNL